MKVRTSFNVYSSGPYSWSATEDNGSGSYDGYLVGLGATRDEAITDLERLMREKTEYEEEVQRLRKFR
jgi:hypothetical protein